MKIGLITGEFPPMPGGVGRFARVLAERMQRQGHEVHVLSRAGCESDSLPISAIRSWGLGSFVPIQAWMQKHRFDVINLQFQTAAYDMSPFVHFLPSMIAAPFVTSFHDLRFPYLFPKAGRLRDWIVMHLARCSDGIITTNQEDDRRLQTLTNRTVIPIGSVILSSLGADYDRSQWRRRVGADEQTFLLGHFGFVKEFKGINYLIDALAHLCRSGHDLRLVFIGGRSNAVDGGKDESYLRHLNTRIRRLGLEKFVHWTGFLAEDEVAAWLRAVDLVTLPFLDGASYRRGSLIAAIHNGCAIMTTYAKIQTDAFRHGHNLWLIPSHSAAEIERGIIHLMPRPHQLNDLRRGAYELRRRFDWDEIAGDTAAFFETLLP